MSPWKTLGAVAPSELETARLELHHAAQLVAIGVGRALVPARDDDSHTTLFWQTEAAQWVGEEIPGTAGARAGLDPARFELSLGRGTTARRLDLLGRSRGMALDWLGEQITELGGAGSDVELDIHYELPSHPAERGAPLTGEPAAGRREVARWFGNAAGLLEEIAAAEEHASDVRTWPHHFDIAFLLPEGPAEDRHSQTIGVGLSPGDGSYAEPYFYVNVWPAPEVDDPGQLPALPRGIWHTEGFCAAILTGSELLRDGDEGQEERAREFLRAAIKAGRQAHGLE